MKYVKKVFSPESSVPKAVFGFVVLALFILGALGYLDGLKQILSSESFTFTMGEFQLSAYRLLKGLVVLAFLIWTASFLSKYSDTKLVKYTRIKPSNRALISKGLQVMAYIFAFLIAFKIFGFDLTALAVFSGAVGVGIGFGLQKITSNFISGIILLFEKSIEEGDLVELNDGTYGFIKRTGARYTLVETFDTKEIMIPNEDFITQRVTNWTYSNTLGRADIAVGVSYDSDIEKAREIILNAAVEHPLSSKNRQPQVYLTEFGDSSVNFLLYFWVDDVTQGRFEPKSDVLRTIWREFKEQGITIPYPQRDIHIKEGSLSG